MVTKQSIYSNKTPYQFGDALRAFEARTQAPKRVALGSNVPWSTPTEDLGSLPSQADLTATAIR